MTPIGRVLTPDPSLAGMMRQSLEYSSTGDPTVFLEWSVNGSGSIGTEMIQISKVFISFRFSNNSLLILSFSWCRSKQLHVCTFFSRFHLPGFWAPISGKLFQCKWVGGHSCKLRGKIFRLHNKTSWWVRKLAKCKKFWVELSWYRYKKCIEEWIESSIVNLLFESVWFGSSNFLVPTDFHSFVKNVMSLFFHNWF